MGVIMKNKKEKPLESARFTRVAALQVLEQALDEMDKIEQLSSEEVPEIFTTIAPHGFGGAVVISTFQKNPDFVGHHRLTRRTGFASLQDAFEASLDLAQQGVALSRSHIQFCQQALEQHKVSLD